MLISLSKMSRHENVIILQKKIAKYNFNWTEKSTSVYLCEEQKVDLILLMCGNVRTVGKQTYTLYA